MENKIKTAYEKALERLEKLNLDQVDTASLEYVPLGRSLAARFLQEKDFDLLGAIKGYIGTAARYVREGVEETLLQNLQLPRDEAAMETNRRAMEGLLLLKENKNLLRQIFKELEYLFSYYAQAREHAYRNLKENFAARLASAQEALERQLGVRVRVEVEQHPLFQEEWLRLEGELASQYESILAEQKRKIRSLK
ncbi:hypothetical protein [Ammonifex thiophilus]|uniref:Uncharacterized protein n=1 Tax=Ammonifex thiophilus TaxID=444093 RepID=A0A3D8P781_9THEO|nr:hypothetical protein [Ammonifex thiophilus]RDV84179.1 hypothetical protein DXX99_02380 [Ammonifex thiophilus]